jgi:hypothetical protein
LKLDFQTKKSNKIKRFRTYSLEHNLYPHGPVQITPSPDLLGCSGATTQDLTGLAVNVRDEIPENKKVKIIVKIVTV